MNIKEKPCANCKMSRKYEENSKALMSKIWYWHTSFCPGWKLYFKSLNPEGQEECRKKYNLK